MIQPVILSGGSGSRLWPLSREEYPKQLLPLHGEQTLLQQTVSRLAGLPKVMDPLIVCNESHRFLVAEQMRQAGCRSATIILEPCGRNTAPAVAIAALQAQAAGDDPLLLVLPADHLIQRVDLFQQAIIAGVELAGQGRLITFGVVPDKPETGYGYIKAGSVCGSQGGLHQASRVESFVEKPDPATAETYVASGDYFWNSGMFLFKASAYLEELKRFAPVMLDACRKAHAALAVDLDFLRLDPQLFGACPADSIDYAVMEKTAEALVIPFDAGWNDVGSWSALWDVGPRDAAGNVVRGDVLTESARNSYLYAGSRMLAAVGVENLIVVETADAVLVAHREHAQDVKQIVGQLKGQSRSEAFLHKRVNRPWGAYECVDVGERFQVKRISVLPGASLSLQMHHHRAEHWVVVRGTARVTCEDQCLILSENQSTYIPLGKTHRLENPGQIPLELIEVQSGSYLGEDDIVRFEDDYGR
jgi:mannose-1-phosphate guanylyltransferase/mannose-6-phosphate isomerase